MLFLSAKRARQSPKEKSNLLGEGLSALHLSSNSGMEISISYIGRYTGFFSDKDKQLFKKDISANTENPDEQLSFLSNMLEIRVEFLLGMTPKGKKF
jgi:hypothetical protein